MTPAGLLLLAQLCAAPAPGPAALVEARSVVPSLQVDLRYATSDNFLGRAVYPKEARCLLVPEAAQKLAEVARALEPQGFALKVYDCYRPRSVQYEMWKLVPKKGYVANPEKGSHHNRGAAVDLTLVTLDGAEVEMPTPYDTFKKQAHHGVTLGVSPAAQANRERLLRAMEAAGFKKNRMEWWHYELPKAARFPLRDEPLTATEAQPSAD